MKTLKKAKYIAMDTEFPGTVFKSEDLNKGMNFEKYTLVKENCDKLKLI